MLTARQRSGIYQATIRHARGAAGKVRWDVSKHFWLVDPDGGGRERIRARNMDHVREQASRWLDEYERAITPVSETAWISVDVLDLARDHLVTFKRTVDPDEPDCDDDDGHAWERDGTVRGHGGGVVIDEACSHCAWHRVTDTWAQNPSTGEQGLTSVKYRKGL